MNCTLVLNSSELVNLVAMKISVMKSEKVKELSLILKAQKMEGSPESVLPLTSWTSPGKCRDAQVKSEQKLIFFQMHPFALAS